MSQPSSRRNGSEFFESLEKRTMLSVTPADLRAAGFVSMQWQGQETFVKPGEWVVNIDGLKGGRAAQVKAANGLLGNLGKGIKVSKHLGAKGLMQISAPESASFEQVKGTLAGVKGFASLRPVLALWQQTTTPTDLNTNLWGLNNTGQTVVSSSNTSDSGIADADVDAVEAWDLTTGDTRVVVADIDSGIDYRHLDLYKNIWINQHEIPTTIYQSLTDTDGDKLITFRDLNSSINQGSGKITDLNSNGVIDGGDLLHDSSGWEDAADADSNSYTDDIVGWNFFANHNDPLDDQRHGTHTAGTIGAIANNGGLVGMNWSVQMMALKVLSAEGSTSDTIAAEAIRYAADNGARVSNNSYGGTGGASGDAMDTAIAHAATKDHLFIAAAGNGDWLGRGINNDSKPLSSQFVPASYDQPNIISVAATDNNDNLASFSNYGATTVDLAAPGVSIASTVPGNVHAVLDGTSMAAPHVTGAAALAYALRPGATYDGIKSILMNSTDWKSSLDGKLVTEGRLNADRALRQLPAAAPTEPDGLAATVASSTRIDLRWNDVAGETRYELQRSQDSTFQTGVTQVTLSGNTTFHADTGLSAGKEYFYRVRAANEAGPSAWSATASGKTPIPVVPNAPSGLQASALSHSQIKLTWTDNSSDELRFKIHRSTDSTFSTFVELTAPANSTSSASYTDGGLTAGTVYHYRVIAVNSSSDSAASAPASASTVPPAPVGNGDGLVGQYFDNRDFTALKFTRTDGSVSFDWGNGSPSPSRKIKMGTDTFSVRWTGSVQPRYSEVYTFRTETDDGVGLWINGVKMWTPTYERSAADGGLDNTSPYEASIRLEAGEQYSIEMRYYENAGGARAKLLWRSASQAQQVIPQSQLYTTMVPTVTTSGTKLEGTSMTTTQASASHGSRFAGSFSSTTLIGEEASSRIADEVLELTADTEV